MEHNFTYLFVYLSICGFLIIYSLVIMTKLSSDVASETELRYFKRILITFLVVIATEVVYPLGNFKWIPFSALASGITNAIGMSGIALCCYYWFLYAETNMNLKALESRTVRFLTSLPFLIITALYIASFWTGWLFDTSSGVSEHGPLYWVPLVVDDIYLLFVAAHALVMISNEKSSYTRRGYLSLIFFVIPPVVSGILDSLVPNTPVMVLGIFTSLYFIFTSTQDSRIYNDALTGLNNRRSADKQCENMLSEVSTDNPFYLFLMDIDLFKSINDTYGHMEGDRALQLTTTALKRVVDKHPRAFCARWGGDEFMSLVFENAIVSPDDFMQNVHQAMWEVRKENKVTYELTMSIGYARCTSPSTDSNTLVRDADAMLYKNKQILHNAHDNDSNVTKLG